VSDVRRYEPHVGRVDTEGVQAGHLVGLCGWMLDLENVTDLVGRLMTDSRLERGPRKRR